VDLIQVGKSHYWLVVLFASILVSAPSVHAKESSTPTDLSIRLYVDGFVDVYYELETDPILARVNITLPGRTYENLLVKDQDGLLLDHKIYGDIIAVDVLGAQSVEIDYSTSDLTNKVGSMWSLGLVSPIEVNTWLPREATIISLSPVPMSIRTLEDRTSLTMPAGEITISYVIGVVGTKAHALALRKEAEAAVEGFKAEGFEVEDALTLLQLAKKAYDDGQYIQAEQYARQVNTWIDQTRTTALEALSEMETAAVDIESAELDRRTSLLDQAKDELEEAHITYDSGDYEGAKSLAQVASVTAQISKSVSWFKKVPIVPLAGTIATVPLIIAYFFRKRKAEPIEILAEPKDEKIGVDLDSIFEQNRFLRLDDKEVIRFIYESGGGVFASELRERFDLPKSSAWRMIRRLEKEEIVETKKVGRETYIQISTRLVQEAAELVEPGFQLVPAGSY
jgi:uncharacterized membrane protein